MTRWIFDQEGSLVRDGEQAHRAATVARVHVDGGAGLRVEVQLTVPHDAHRPVYRDRRA